MDRSFSESVNEIIVSIRYTTTKTILKTALTIKKQATYANLCLYVGAVISILGEWKRVAKRRLQTLIAFLTS